MQHVITLAALVGFLGAGRVSAAEPGGADNVPSLEAVLGKDTVLKKNIAYGVGEKQKLDVYAPKDAKGAPVVMYVHGGEWTKGDKAEVAYKPKLFTESSIVFVSVNYRLSPAAKHPDHVSDVAAAVRWVKDHIAEHGGDPKKIVLMGHSAGCHLVVLTTLDPRYLAAARLTASDVRGVICWSGGSFDLLHKAKVDDAFAPYIRRAFGEDEATWKDASPTNQTKHAKNAPPYLFVTADPTGDSFKIAQVLAKGIRDGGGRSSTLILKDRTHKTANALLGAPGDTTGSGLLEFVREVTK